ncbi:xanthine dehydrogenase family protein molybdopterin-binding subunit [Neptunicella marina]|uniref:Xanthine dehydrogenase family protein molybdopterin-binding subunit n=1 Tax=Neptunicella marina TaxID=2125989 RepID=A0A8J6IPB7_9ALTE|nr:molybdopterin cofactor-binding domain-containing protein [Neptunicella marina]MBC3764716.1 xanthine dehydrogenase family protein molybdopterin-binding subunit [Neptunicella marina]
MSDINNLSRRQFLKQTGIVSGGLVLGASMPGWAPAWAATGSANALNLFVSIRTDNTVEIICHRSEMGQGIRTGLPQVLADELMADWSKIEVIQGLANEEYGSQNTDGSRSMRHFYSVMREMGASARAMLEQAAANNWGVASDQVEALDHQVVNKLNGQSLSFGQLARAASLLEAPKKQDLTFKSPADFKYIGKGLSSVDMSAFVTGNTTYGQDVQLPGMLYASIERAPVLGSKLVSVDDSECLKVKGVLKTIKMPDQTLPAVFKPLPGVAVIATNTWAAIQGRKKLKLDWDTGANKQHDSAAFHADMQKRIVSKGKVFRHAGDAYTAMESASERISAQYNVPYLVHAPMEPPAATAQFKDGMMEIWACTQTPQSTQNTVASILGLDKNKVKVHVTLLGGGFGRKSKPDFSVEAAYLAQQTGKPVKVCWTREDDIQNGYYHAISSQFFEAGMDESGKVTAWIQRTSFPSISWTFTSTTDEPSGGELGLGFGDVPVDVANLSCETHKATGHTRIGWLRSVCNIQHGFALGSFVDELASASKQDTQSMWLTLLGENKITNPNKQGYEYGNYGDPQETFPIDGERLKAVLNRVCKEANTAGPTVKNEAWGISVHRSFVSYCAVATKVRVENNKLTVLEMHLATDCGLAVNPDRVKSQMEGAMVFGLSLALMGEITYKEGAVVQSNYHDYPVLRMPQSPPMQVYILENDHPPGGVGEPGVPPVAASLTNAIYHACGKRIRDLPVNKVLTV